MKEKRMINKRMFYSLFVIGVTLLLGIGVYAYNTSSPSVFGHSGYEIEGACKTDGSDCPEVGSVYSDIIDERFWFYSNLLDVDNLALSNYLCYSISGDFTKIFVPFSDCVPGSHFRYFEVNEACKDECVSNTDYTDGIAVYSPDYEFCRTAQEVDESSNGYHCRCFNAGDLRCIQGEMGGDSY